jgi:SAM-dependent methyltransferase
MEYLMRNGMRILAHSRGPTATHENTSSRVAEAAANNFHRSTFGIGRPVARLRRGRYSRCLGDPTAALSQLRAVPKGPASRRFFSRLKGMVLRPPGVYRLYLRAAGASRLSEAPGPNLCNGTLKSQGEWEATLAKGKKLHVPLHRDDEKNWDHLAAVTTILDRTDRSARILDAGAEMYSNVLPALFLYGYRELYGINLSFTAPTRRGPIRYLPGDLTHTPFPGNHFDAITCLSVIEHGVPLESYFREMYRILKPNGLLITSTDYYPSPIDTRGQFAHGTPIKIFSQPEIQAALGMARSVGFELTGEVDLECDEKPIHWEPFDLEYTFVLFTLRKPGCGVISGQIRAA